MYKDLGMPELGSQMANALVKTQKLKRLSDFGGNMAESRDASKTVEVAIPVNSATPAAAPASSGARGKDAYVKEKITLKELGDYNNIRARNAKPYAHDPCKTADDIDVTCDELDDALKRIKQDKYR